MAKKDTQGFFIRPERDLVNRLERLSKEFKKESANKVAVDVIAEYLDFWEERERARQEVDAIQRKRFTEFKKELLNQRLLEIEPKPVTKPAAKRKTK